MCEVVIPAESIGSNNITLTALVDDDTHGSTAQQGDVLSRLVLEVFGIKCDEGFEYKDEPQQQMVLPGVRAHQDPNIEQNAAEEEVTK